MDRSDSKEVPSWWAENDELKSSMNIPAYEPPRFEDGVYTHEVSERLREQFGIEFQFIGVNTNYPDEWEVRMDGETHFSIPHMRDENGNTVYGMTAEEFETRIEAVITE